MNELIEKTIDPARLNLDAREAKTFGIRNVQRRWIRSEAFIAIWEIMRLIAESTSFDKKSRIVLEYDPECEKFSVVTVTE